jgi:cysteine-rich repeat protein
MKWRNRLPLAVGASMLLCVLAPGPLPAAETPQVCRIVVGVDGAATLGGVELELDYEAAEGEFAGAGESVECTSIAAGVFATARDDDQDRRLDLAMISVLGVALPQDFWRCTFVPEAGIPGMDSFVVTVQEALDPGGAPVEATATLRTIECDDMAVCGNGIVEGAEECDDGMASSSCDDACRLTYDSLSCAIDLRASGSTAIGGLQFQLDYGDAPGEFVGQGPSVACRATIESALTAHQDDDANRHLRFGMVTPFAINLPASLWQCRFVTNPAPLSLAAFRFEEVVAIDAALKEVPVQLQAVAGACIFGPRCGDGIAQDNIEECDDGNGVNTDACTNACALAVCGDAIVRDGVEECDDGNAVETDACRNSCTLAVCGDAVVRTGVEECDDGNDVNVDACSNACTLPICGDANGDGFVRASDALQVLRAAVGQASVCPGFRCDADNNGTVQAADALRILRRAVGQLIELVCPAP